MVTISPQARTPRENEIGINKELKEPSSKRRNQFLTWSFFMKSSCISHLFLKSLAEDINISETGYHSHDEKDVKK